MNLDGAIGMLWHCGLTINSLLKAKMQASFPRSLEITLYPVNI